MQSMQSLPLRRIDHQQEDGCWTLWRKPPPPALRPYVLELQAYSETSGRAVARTELPSHVVPLIIILGEGFTLHDPGLAATPPRPLARSFVAGLHRRPVTVGSAGRSLCMQVDLTPLGARRLLRSDLGPLADKVVSLDALDPVFAAMLDERLRTLNGWEHRFSYLEAMLADRILAAPADDRRLAAAFRAIEASRGAVRIDPMATSLAVSRKHLATLFRQQFGISPKALARLIRFAEAVRVLEAGGGGLADLAARCGYADQPHFNRDFTEFAGESPSSLIQRLTNDRTGIMAPAG